MLRRQSADPSCTTYPHHDKAVGGLPQLDLSPWLWPIAGVWCFSGIVICILAD